MSRWIDPSRTRAYIVAEIGANHNGRLQTAINLVDAAWEAGCDAVKGQLRDCDLAIPERQKEQIRDTPWGRVTYLDYRRKLELDLDAHRTLANRCRKYGMDYFLSVWDTNSAAWDAQLETPLVKVPSAGLTHHDLILACDPEKDLVLSTGMSTEEEVRAALDVAIRKWEPHHTVVCQATSTYPAEHRDLNLRVIQWIERLQPWVIPGYSGHERGIATTVAARALGAMYLERHFTLDRTMWGTDHAASLEPQGMKRLVRDVRAVEQALGSSKKVLLEVEKPARIKLRGT